MMALLRGMDMSAYSPRCYVVAETDRMSGQKAHALEAEVQAEVAAAAAALAGGTEHGAPANNGAAATDGAGEANGDARPAAGGAPSGVQTRRQAAAAAEAVAVPVGAGLHHRALRKRGQQQAEHAGDGGSQGVPYQVVQIPRSRWAALALPHAQLTHSRSVWRASGYDTRYMYCAGGITSECVLCTGCGLKKRIVEGGHSIIIGIRRWADGVCVGGLPVFAGPIACAAGLPAQLQLLSRDSAMSSWA